MRRSRWNRFGAAACLTLLLLLIAANKPFYAGSSVGTTFNWRLEHGRLTIVRSPVRTFETFYIAINAGPLLWAPDWHFYAQGDWYVRLPLWMPASLCLLWSVWAWWPPRRRGECSKCGYSLSGLPLGSACPECGMIGAARTRRLF